MMPPSANPFRWARLVNMPEFAPRAFRPITTPSPPRDSMFTPLTVPAMWPGDPLNHPTVNAPGPGANIDHGMDAVEPRRRCGLRPKATFTAAEIRPEQSYPPGPTPPHTYGLPTCDRTNANAPAKPGWKPPKNNSPSLTIVSKTLCP